jgi:hypothetical protein
MLNVVVLIVTFYLLFAECHYADCRYADCRYAECRGAITILLSVFSNDFGAVCAAS